jgi:hypothetical protein
MMLTRTTFALTRSLTWATIVFCAVTQGCASDGGSACEEAREEMQRHISAVCAEPAYLASQFCSVCVAKGYYSVSGAADTCRCADLVFDVDFCAFERGTNARPKVRGAVSGLVASCPQPIDPASSNATLRSGPGADAGVSQTDTSSP